MYLCEAASLAEAGEVSIGVELKEIPADGMEFVGRGGSVFAQYRQRVSRLVLLRGRIAGRAPRGHDLLGQ